MPGWKYILTYANFILHPSTPTQSRSAFCVTTGTKCSISRIVLL